LALVYLLGNLADEIEPEPLEFVVLNQLVQVDPKQLERDAQVRAEVEVVNHVHHVVVVMHILGADVVQNLHLDERLRRVAKRCGPQ
jgi:cytochrome b561